MAIGGFFGAFANMLSGLATSSMQRSDNEYLMNKQAELNKEQADYSTDLAKNYWDYTNYENSVKHLKEAGLNPALFYAKGGQGGAKQYERAERRNTVGKYADNLRHNRKLLKDQSRKLELDRLERRNAQQRLQQLSDGFPGLNRMAQPKQQQRQKSNNGRRRKPRRRSRKGQINELCKTTHQSIQSK